MPTIWIPALLRPLTGGMDQVAVIGATIEETLDDLDRRYPGVKSRLCAGTDLRPGLAVVVDGAIVRQGLDHPVRETSEVHFVQAIAGGSSMITG